MEKEQEWFDVLEVKGARGKFLIPPGAGPAAILLDCPPDCAIPAPAPVFGRYEVVLSGSVRFDGKLVQPPGLRYVAGDEQAEPIQTGAEGAKVILLSFDSDAAQGGLGDDQLSRAAAHAIEQAI
jgi:hypothetical protein